MPSKKLSLSGNRSLSYEQRGSEMHRRDFEERRGEMKHCDSYKVVMIIFAHQGPGNALSNCRIVLSNCRDVDEEAGIGVNPPAINDV